MQPGSVNNTLHISHSANPDHRGLNHADLGKSIQIVYAYRQGEKLCVKIFRVTLVFTVQNMHLTKTFFIRFDQAYLLLTTVPI